MQTFSYGALLAWWIITSAGCGTLSSLGLSLGSADNYLLKSARRISERPGVAIDLPRELEKFPLDTYVVEIGDIISVETVSFDATIRLPGDQPVSPDGTISLGEFGALDVAGKTIAQIQAEVEATIQARLEMDVKSQAARAAGEGSEQTGGDDETINQQLNRLLRANRVSVRLINWDSKVVYVLGEVNSPGSFPFTGNQTVLDAIVAAGGLTSAGNSHRIVLARPTPSGSCRIVLSVCYEQIVQLGDTSTNYQLLPGDRVFVPSLTLIDDLKKTLAPGHAHRCPRCAAPPQGCY